MSLLKRLEGKQEDLEATYGKLRKKLRRLRNRYAIENDTEYKLKLEESIDECQEQLEEIEEKLDDIEEKINSYKRGNYSNDIDKFQNYEDLYKALLKLGYWEQQRLFEKVIITKKESHGAFLIHGNSDEYGQRWLMNRLALAVSPKWEAKSLVIDLNRISLKTNILGIWEELAYWVNLEEGCPHNLIVAEILKLCMSQNVFICFNNVNEYIEDDLKKIIQSFWRSIVKNILDNQCQKTAFKMLVFFLDYQGIVPTWNLDLVNDYHPQCKTYSPFNLPELIPFSVEVIRTWLEQQSDRLPNNISFNKEETLRILLEKEGIPEKTLRKICSLCGCNWLEQEKRWLRL